MRNQPIAMGDKAKEISDLHAGILQKLQESFDMAIRVGGILVDVKADLKHGQFETWLKANVPFTARTARNYMKLWRNRDRLKRKQVSDLKSAYRLLSTHKPEIDIVDIIVKDAFDFFRETDGRSVDEFPTAEARHIIGQVVYNWVLLKIEKKHETIESWFDWAKNELGSKVTITNEWHDGFVTCWCSKCNGKVIDVRGFYSQEAA